MLLKIQWTNERINQKLLEINKNGGTDTKARGMQKNQNRKESSFSKCCCQKGRKTESFSPQLVYEKEVEDCTK